MIEGRIWTASACDLADSIRTGDLKAVEVVEVFLERIDRFDGDIHAFVETDPEGALEQALGIDRRIASGEDPGPLAGVPVGVKDLEEAAGLPTRRGSLVASDDPAPADSIQVQRLRDAGAVIVGKTATPEFGSLAYTWSQAWGATRNPWSLEATPGGSSGGSAAAVAAGLVPLATGSDGGGSIRIPAGYCGIPGLKPTNGLVPALARRQLVQLSSRGPLAATVEDIARALDQVAGEHPGDPSSIPKPLHPFEDQMKRGAVRCMERRPARPLKAVWSSTLGFGWCDPAVAAITRSAAERLMDAAGMEEVDRSVDLPEADSGWLNLWALNSYVELRDFWPLVRAEMTPVVAAVFEAGERLGPGDLADAGEQRLRLFDSVNAVLEEADVILTPTMPSPAFPAEGPMPGRDRVTDNELGVDPMSGVCFSYPFNLTGHPAISIPAGFDQRGVPLGLQIVGPRFSDARLLALARCMEETNPWPRVPPDYA